MEKQFVPYELALKLKEIGFDEDCFGYYGEPLIGKQERFSLRLDWTPESYPFKNELHCLAPLWQQAFDWFRINKYLYADVYRTGKVFSANIEYILMGNSLCEVIEDVSYEEARLECLKKLIELCKLNLI